MRSMQMYRVLWIGCCLGLGTLAMGWPERMAGIATSPSTSSAPVAEAEEDPFAPVLELALPEHVITILLNGYQNENFKKVHLASHFGPPANFVLRLISISLLGLTLTIPSVFVLSFCWVRSYVARFMGMIFVYTVAALPLLMSFQENYRKYLLPGFCFVTDAGILVVERGATDQFSTFYYKDMELVKDTFITNIDVEGIAVTRVLRIVDKQGQIHDYETRWFDPSVYDKIYPFVYNRLVDLRRQ